MCEVGVMTIWHHIIECLDRPLCGTGRVRFMDLSLREAYQELNTSERTNLFVEKMRKRGVEVTVHEHKNPLFSVMILEYEGQTVRVTGQQRALKAELKFKQM